MISIYGTVQSQYFIFQSILMGWRNKYMNKYNSEANVIIFSILEKSIVTHKQDDVCLFGNIAYVWGKLWWILYKSAVKML